MRRVFSTSIEFIWEDFTGGNVQKPSKFLDSKESLEQLGAVQERNAQNEKSKENSGQGGETRRPSNNPHRSGTPCEPVRSRSKMTLTATPGEKLITARSVAKKKGSGGKACLYWPGPMQMRTDARDNPFRSQERASGFDALKQTGCDPK